MSNYRRNKTRKRGGKTPFSQIILQMSNKDVLLQRVIRVPSSFRRRCSPSDVLEISSGVLYWVVEFQHSRSSFGMKIYISASEPSYRPSSSQIHSSVWNRFIPRSLPMADIWRAGRVAAVNYGSCKRRSAVLLLEGGGGEIDAAKRTRSSAISSALINPDHLWNDPE